MSTTTDSTDTDSEETGPLTADEREVFERLADRFDGEDIGRICVAVLQSRETDSEEASS